MKPLIPQTVYVESSEGILANYWARRIDAVEEQKYLEKKENQYILSREELIELIKQNISHGWEACQKWNDWIDDDGSLGVPICNKMPLDKKDFIKKQIKDDYEY